MLRKTSAHLPRQILATCRSHFLTPVVTQKCLKMKKSTLLIGIIQRPILGVTVMPQSKLTQKKNFFIKSQPQCMNLPAHNHVDFIFTHLLFSPPALIFCEYCLKMQRSKEDLKDHYKKHPEYAAFVCGWCKLATKDLKTFERHRKFAHQMVSQYQLCQLCGKLGQTLHRFKLHMKDHDAGRTINCTQCNWTFRTKACLKRHMVNHQEASVIECNFCLKKFKTLRHFKEHIRVHIQGK